MIRSEKRKDKLSANREISRLALLSIPSLRKIQGGKVHSKAFCLLFVDIFWNARSYHAVRS